MSRPGGRWAAWPLFLAYAVFVVYGSLVPLEFRALPLDQAWARFLHIPFLQLGLDSRADWVANGVLYAPLAFLAVRAGVGAGLAQGLAVGLAIALCAALAVGVEFTQLFFPARTVSQNDILAEWIGSAVGALAAPALAGWLAQLGRAWTGGGARLALRLLEAYAAAYLLLCFFPYDLLLSQAEVLAKWQSRAWGWWLAPRERGLFLTLLQLAVEVALALPFGVLLAQRLGGRRGLAWPAAAGLLLGLVIEVGQFFVATGISQGASVLTRVVGVGAGAHLAPWLHGDGLQRLRAGLRRAAWPLWAVYLPVLAVAGGWSLHGWHGLAGAAAAWPGVHLLPFYYHYYTSEALAMFSLGSVALMYLPVAVLGWARGWRVAPTVLAAGLLAAVIETGKLFLDGRRPDPTNLIVAAVAVLLGLRALALAERGPAAAGTAADPVQATSARGSAWLLVLPPVLAWAALFPVWPLALALGLAACAAAVWRWPVLALGLLPAALPLLDLAPWSGRFFLDEFDLLALVCLAVALHRTPPPADSTRASGLRPLTWACVLLGLSLAASTARALAPLPWPDDNSFSSYTSPYNALRIVKGAVGALLFVVLWRRLPAQGGRRALAFETGIALGLAGTVAVVLWERVVFTGLWDFAADFRVTGPISAMHKGGAYIECWLAVATAFVWCRVLRGGPWAPRLLSGGLVVVASYAMMVTYSRNGYAALAAVLLTGVAVGVRWPRASWRQRAWAGGALAVVVAVVLPIAGGGYARQRLQQSGQDLAVRQAHWADGLALRDGSLATALIGMGVGRFPDAHFWRSREPVHAASYGLARDGERRLLRLAQGATLYIEQIVPRPSGTTVVFSADLRTAGAPVDLEVALCEKWTLTSSRCAGGMASAGTPGAWQTVEVTIDLAPLRAEAPRGPLPLKFALLTPQSGTLDVSRVRLLDGAAGNLLANGDFAQGMDRWFFATDADPPWHLHSLPVAVLFDQGWLGVLAWAAVVVSAVVAGVRLAWRGQAEVPAALAAVAGFLVSGSLNTLIDAPRFLWLLLVLLWLAAAPAPSGSKPAAGAGRGAPSP